MNHLIPSAKTWVVGPFQCNCRLIVCPNTGHGALIDPGDEAQQIIQNLEETKTADGRPVEIKYLLHTHGHLDHIGATRSVKESFQKDAPRIALHRDDEPLYLMLKTQGQMFGFTYQDPLPVDHYLEDGEELKLGDLKLSVIHTPGHSPGSVCLRLHQDTALGQPEALFTGDTLFKASVGRTDLWGGSQDQMFRSIRERIFTLDDDTRVCPGHGTDSQVGWEKKSNPFFR